MFHRKTHNFLKAKRFSRFKPEHPAARGARAAGFAALAVAAALALLILPFWFLSSRVYASADKGRVQLNLAEQAAAALDFDAALKDADEAGASFVAAQKELARLRPFDSVPVLGPNLVAADRLLSSGIAAASAARDLFAIGRDITRVVKETEAATGAPFAVLPDASTLFKDLTPERKRRILASLAEAGPKLADASARIGEALAAFDQIPAQDLPGSFRGSLATTRAKLLSMRAAVADVQPFAGAAPGILGYPDEKHYLFFFENNTELRPTGGFLGVFGALTVRDAGIAEMRTDDVYALDGPAESGPRPAPPEPIRKYVGVDKWYLRDANWSPDFAVSAKVMERFFREESASAATGRQAPPVDGIIAITPKFVQDVMRLTGPITAGGKIFTADNLVDELEFQVEQGFVKGGIPFNRRKVIVGALMKAIVSKLSSFPLSRLVEAVGMIEQDIKEGHLLLYSADASLQRIILANGWGGALAPVSGDYLMYVDANLASLKTDGVMQRDLSYSIAPDRHGGFDGTIRMTYRNNGGFSWKTTRYRTYARLYVPAGTTLAVAAGAMENDKIKDPGRHPGRADVMDELGRRVFGAFISVEPGETRTLEFRFKLAPAVADAVRGGTYRLDVQKQAGTLAHGLTLDLDFGKKLTNAEPPEDRGKWGDARYTYATDLRVDRTFEIRF